jgi:acetylornithine/N-succinyldiaminopimelate aminotransferase
MIGVKTVKSENEVVAKMMENGVLALTAHGGMVRLLPPLNISDADLKKALDVLLAAAA